MNSRESLFMKRMLSRMQSLQPYSTGKKLCGTQDNILRLDSNENLFLTETYIQGILTEAVSLTDPRLYSEGEVQRLVQSLSKYLNIDPDTIVFGSGGDGIIDMIAGSVMSPKDSALVIEPTFSMYRKCLSTHGRVIRTVYLDDTFILNVENVVDALQGTNEVVFLCSPNNPSGNQYARKDIQTIVESTDGLVVVDEAYAEFAPENLIDLVEDYENLLLMRTFSKAFGLAGMRIGYAITNYGFASTLRNHVVLPYPVSSLSLVAAQLMIEKSEYVSKVIKQVIESRERLSKALNKVREIQVHKSVTNFMLLEVSQSSTLFSESLLKMGIKVRVINFPQNDRNFVRITVPPLRELERVVQSIKEILE